MPKAKPVIPAKSPSDLDDEIMADEMFVSFYMSVRELWMTASALLLVAVGDSYTTEKRHELSVIADSLRRLVANYHQLPDGLHPVDNEPEPDSD